MPSYQYSPLEGANHIRLLCVESGSGNSPIMCTFTQAAMKDKPRYTALSYTWELGNADSDEVVNAGTIICDGGELSVAANLHAALKSFRARQGGADYNDLPFWIDAICINQTDNEERSQQIQIMHLIYSQAYHVIAWLGEEQATDKGAKSAFDQLSRYIESRNGNFNPKEVLGHFENPGDSAMPKPDSDEWVAIASILSKRWFSRVWIIQEYTMAPHLSFRCGDIELSPSVIKDVLAFLAASTLTSFIILQKTKQAVAMVIAADLANSIIAKSKSWAFMEILFVTRYFQTSVSKDRFFAFLGFIKKESQSPGVPDYNLPQEEIYTQLAVHSLLEERSFLGLSLVPLSQPFNGMSLPTWVPDWGAAPLWNCLSKNITFRTLTFRLPHINFSGCHSYLTMRGVRLDIIRTVGNKQAWKHEWPPHGNLLPETLEILLLARDFIDEAENIATETFSPHIYPLEMFWRTLIFNSIPNARSEDLKAPPEYAQSFKSYREILAHINSEHFSTLGNLFWEARYYEQAYIVRIADRKFGTTKGLRMGMFPYTVQQNDIIVAFMGANVPFVLREAEDGRYRLVGECYLHGYMYGELARELDWEKNIEDITLC